jgi:hypothetical protein
MDEVKNCLLIKYRLERNNNDIIEKCFVLNDIYSKKFKTNPIYEIEVSYPISIGYDCDYDIAKLYFMESISIYTHNEIKRLFLVDDETDYIVDELNKLGI